MKKDKRARSKGEFIKMASAWPRRVLAQLCERTGVVMNRYATSAEIAELIWTHREATGTLEEILRPEK